MRRYILHPNMLIVVIGLAIFACGEAGPTAVDGDTTQEPEVTKLAFSGTLGADTVIHTIPNASMDSPPLAQVFVKDYIDGFWTNSAPVFFRENNGALEAVMRPWGAQPPSVEYRLTVTY